MLRRTDEPQPRRRLNHPSVINHFRQHLFASSETVDDAAGSPAQGGWRQGLVMPTVSVSKGAKPGTAKPPGSSHGDSGFMALARRFALGEREMVSWHFTMRLLYVHTTLDREYLDILCNPWSLRHHSILFGSLEPKGSNVFPPLTMCLSCSCRPICRSVHVVDRGSLSSISLRHILPKRGFSHQPALACCVGLGRP
jgi:hypothetical protein